MNDSIGALGSGILLVVVGLFAIVCACCDFDWFMNNYRARFFVEVLGRRGARVFYVVLGCVFLVIGLVVAF